MSNAREPVASGPWIARQNGLSDEELAERKVGWTPLQSQYTTGVLGKYAKLVQGAETGAITNTLW